MTYWKDWDLGCYFNFGFVGNAWLCKLRLKYAATGGSSLANEVKIKINCGQLF